MNRTVRRVCRWVMDRLIHISYTSDLCPQRGDHQFRRECQRLEAYRSLGDERMNAFRHHLAALEADGEPLEPFDPVPLDEYRRRRDTA